jgi:hypothetical protein
MELERLITQLVTKSRSTQTAVGRLEELHFPSPNPLRLAHLIRNLCAALAEHILARYQAGVRSKDDFADQVRFAIDALRQLGAHLRLVERAATRQTPWSLVQPLERLGQQLHPDSYFIIRPQWSYNYSIQELVSAYRGYFASALPVAALDQAFSVGPEGAVSNLYVVGFPYIERLSVLMHSLFGHELGHPVEKEYFRQENVGAYLPRLNQEVALALNAPPDPQTWDLGTLSQFVRVRDRVRETRRRALAELICDLVGVNLFGPAALFATEELALSMSLDAADADPPSAHYPPWRFRLRSIAEELSEAWVEDFLSAGGFSGATTEAVRGKMQSLRALAARDNDRALLSANPETRIAYELVEAALPRVRRFVRQHLENRGFRMDALKGATNARLLERLANWIPPDACIVDGREEPAASIGCILNVGWVRYLCAYATLPLDGSSADAVEVYLRELSALNRLVLKAIEYLDIRTIWAEHHRSAGAEHGGPGA